jgi:hypothetical protein
MNLLCQDLKLVDDARLAITGCPRTSWTLNISTKRPFEAVRRTSSPIRSLTVNRSTEENSMQTLQVDYFATYRNLKLSRDAKGVLVAEFHSDGGGVA